MAQFTSFFDLREKAEILVCIAIMAIGTPLCYFLGERAAQEDFKLLHPIEESATPTSK
jgi:hypothetical protein